MCIDKGVFKTKIYSSIFAVVLMIAICHSLNAQNQISYNGNIINSIHSIDKALDNNAFDHLISNNSILIGASFSNPLSAKNIQTLKRKGVYLLEYLGNHSYIVGVDKSNPLSELKDLGINHIFEIPVASKIDDEISNSSKDILTLSLHIPVSFQEEAISSLAAMGIQGKAIIAQEFHVIKIKTNKSKVEELAQLPFVLFIGLEQEFYALMDYNNNINGIGSSNTQSANSFGLTGAGVVVGISDVGPVQEQHIDHQDRIIVDNTSGGLHSVSFHGNHVLGTVGGSGIMDEKYSGIAPASELIFSPINTLHNTYYIDNNNMVLSNHSYGAVTVNGSEYGGKYTSHPTLTDMRILENDQVLEIWSAGNSDAGFQTLANGYNVAKNVLTVSGAGMSQTSGLFRPETVSMGPTLDGRIKPEVCANVSNYSTNAENGYRFASGTSMSAPTATGAVALMYEHYRNTNNGNDPKSATLKALLCNTADDYGNVGPDFKWGFGNLNLNKALKALDNTQYSESNIGQSETNSGFLVVPANVKQLKVLLYWHDKNGAPNCNTNCLVNDLDLEVTNTNGNTVLPLILDPSNPSAVATNGVDRINNIEQVIIDNPTPGNYDLKVSGFNLPFGNIDYTLVYEFVTEDMEITFPFEGEHLISDSKYYIIWEDYLGTSESYTIEYSTDGGSNWSTIESNYTIEAFKSRSYYWDLPSLNTDRLKIKISSNGREVETGNIIVSTRTKIEEISFDENNNLDISWEVVQGATSYNIYKYSQGDNQPILITNTNQTNTNINGLDPYFENYMIVEPVFSNGAGIKSTAV